MTKDKTYESCKNKAADKNVPSSTTNKTSHDDNGDTLDNNTDSFFREAPETSILSQITAASFPTDLTEKLLKRRIINLSSYTLSNCETNLL